MGSLTSRPKIQSAPQIIYTTAPQTTQTSSASTDTTSSSQTDGSSQSTSSDAEDAQSASQTRSDNLLLRSRGRQGTVLTSFRGVLSDFTNGASAKTLLGE